MLSFDDGIIMLLLTPGKIIGTEDGHGNMELRNFKECRLMTIQSITTLYTLEIYKYTKYT